MKQQSSDSQTEATLLFTLTLAVNDKKPIDLFRV